MKFRQDPHAPVYVISVAAELADMHPQTLRQYDRMGLVVPARQGGGQRRYSLTDVYLLRRIQTFSRDGVSLEGIRRIVELEKEVTTLRDTVSNLMDQIDVLNSHARFPRTFTAGSSGDVTPEFTVPAPEPAGSAEQDRRNRFDADRIKESVIRVLESSRPQRSLPAPDSSSKSASHVLVWAG